MHPHIKLGASDSVNLVGMPVLRLLIIASGSTPSTEFSGPHIPRSVIYAVPPGKI